MATRRTNATSVQSRLDQHHDDDGQHPEVKSNISPAVPTSVIIKLLAFTFAMITVPLGSYFLSLNLLFRGNSTFAGGLAAFMANVVLIGYIVVAFNDDKSEREADAVAGGVGGKEEEKKKSR